MNTATCNRSVERFVRWLGCGRDAYKNGELRVLSWLVSKRVPRIGVVALMWAIKLIALCVLLYSAFWLALLLIFVVAAALMANAAGLGDEPPKPEWRNGPAGFGLYTYDGFRIDPHIDDD
ncbi:hypothetical protein BV921_15100 [Pectobacterium odoriferum]|uniref:DUF3742 family protein n=1 Tax=Pectobacterium odoriferum TaxID=78398 RepID=UPI000CD2F31E|nr:DUF3742 family protein [Pectobacterium odoriferum]POE08556.1 hypothetical protein BV921_15100 [Pectobacterium odoriferum]